MNQVMLMIGTRKGVFLAFSDEERQTWRLDGPYFKGAEIHYVTAIPTAQATHSIAIHAAGASAWWGPGIQISTDLGRTWEAGSPVRFHQDRDLSVERLWILKAAGDRLLAGVDPGALFMSTGDGDWQEVRALTDHPTRDAWQPGAGGMMVHSICVDPSNADRFYVGVSAAGTFLTEDGGNHWHDISAGLPSRFGFPLAVDPNDGDTLFVVPEESDEHRVTPDGAFRIYRSHDRGGVIGRHCVTDYPSRMRGSMSCAIDCAPTPFPAPVSIVAPRAARSCSVVTAAKSGASCSTGCPLCTVSRPSSSTESIPLQP